MDGLTLERIKRRAESVILPKARPFIPKNDKYRERNNIVTNNGRYNYKNI